MTTKLNNRQINFWSVLVGGILLLTTGFVFWQQTELSKSQQQQQLESEAEALAGRLESLLARTSGITRSLAFVVAQYGLPENLDSLGAVLLNEHPFVDAVELFDKGTITHVYPKEGNEAVLGYDVFADPKLKQEVDITIRSQDFFLAGPFNLRQGGNGFVGRFPIFKNNKWIGFTAVVIKKEEFEAFTKLGKEANEAFAYVVQKQLGEGNWQTIADTRANQNTKGGAQRTLNSQIWQVKVFARDPIGWASQWWILLIGVTASIGAALAARNLLGHPLMLQKQVDKQIHAHQQLNTVYNETIARISDGFASIDQAGIVQICNKQMAKLFGQEADEIVNKSLFTSIEGFAKSPLGMAITASIKNGKGQTLPVQRKGDLKWFDVSLYPGSLGLSMFAKDITKEEETLRLLELTNQVARIGGWEYLPNENRFHLSSTASDLLQLADNQLSLDALETYFGERANEIITELQQLQKTKGHFDIELPIIKQKNKPFWVKIIAESTQDNRSGTRILGTLQDIQSRMLFQEKMADTAQQYRNLFDLTPVPMWTFDARTFKVIAANSAAAKEYGYEQSELIARPISQMFSPGVFSQFLKQLATQSSKALISEHRRKNGQLMYVEMYFTEIEHEKNKAYVLLARDITERLNNMRAIESQNQRLREIAWMQSHKVRAPLARILAIAQLVEPEYFDPNHDKHLIDEICKSAHELDQILMEIVQRTENNGKEK